MVYKLKTVKCPDCGYTFQIVLEENDPTTSHLCVRCSNDDEEKRTVQKEQPLKPITWRKG